MGMYTELHFNVELKEDTPEEIMEVLRYMVCDGVPPSTIPQHELFETSRWAFMLRCGSFYFAAETHSTLRYDDISKSYYLCVRCNLKNYDEEIQKFIDFIDPFVVGTNGDFLGFYRYEESNEPTLIYKK